MDSDSPSESVKIDASGECKFNSSFISSMSSFCRYTADILDLGVVC